MPKPQRVTVASERRRQERMQRQVTSSRQQLEKREAATARQEPERQLEADVGSAARESAGGRDRLMVIADPPASARLSRDVRTGYQRPSMLRQDPLAEGLRRRSYRSKRPELAATSTAANSLNPAAIRNSADVRRDGERSGIPLANPRTSIDRVRVLGPYRKASLPKCVGSSLAA